MSGSFERFLKPRQGRASKASLGRTFNVIRETWRLTDDPQRQPPKIDLVATRRTASEAADLAREAAAGFKTHGFHKPSGAWWASEEGFFHRYAVSIRTPRRAGPVIAVGVATIAALALARRRPRRG